MPTCIDVKFIFDSVHLGLSSSANTLQIADVALQVVVFLFLLCFFAVISPSSSRSSYAWNEWNARHIFFFLHSQNIGALPCSGLHFWRHFLVKHKILPDLVISNWFWLIIHVPVANQNWGNILNE